MPQPVKSHLKSQLLQQSSKDGARPDSEDLLGLGAVIVALPCLSGECPDCFLLVLDSWHQVWAPEAVWPLGGAIEVLPMGLRASTALGVGAQPHCALDRVWKPNRLPLDTGAELSLPWVALPEGRPVSESILRGELLCSSASAVDGFCWFSP